MKKYKLKPRFYVIAGMTALAITSFSVAQIDTVCSKNIERQIVQPVYAETIEEVSSITFENLGKFKITHYCPCEICCGEYGIDRPMDSNGEMIVETSTGEIATAGKTIAVDPNVIPMGTVVYINDEEYIAQDVGGAIKGNRIDIYCDTHEEAKEKGVIYTSVYTEKQSF